LFRPLPLTAFGLSASLLLGLSTQQAVMAAREPAMRVLVQESGVLTFRADGNQPFRLQASGLASLSVQRLRVQLQGGRLRLELEEAGGSPGRLIRRDLPVSGRFHLETEDPRGIWLGQRRYGGELRVLVHQERLQVVNHLGIEPYLTSVVGAEMPQDWPIEALKAQAVAARTYALRQRGRAGFFDVRATVASQVYRGLESATPRTQEAVDSTRSLVLVHGGKLINAVFHSSSGGATEASGEVWRSQLPYLVSVPDHDQESPVHRWQARFDVAQLRKAFQEIGGVRAFQVLQTSSTGRVRSLRVEGPSGALRISGSELRQRLGLKSTMVEFAWLRDGMTSPAVSPTPSATVAPSRWVGMWADQDGDGFAAPLPPPPPPLSEGNPWNEENSWNEGHSLNAESPVVVPVLEVRGRGFGHGVGLSQWGARALAEKGADFQQILSHYYRGVQIRPFRPSDDPAVARVPSLKPAWRG